MCILLLQVEPDEKFLENKQYKSDIKARFVQTLSYFTTLRICTRGYIGYTKMIGYTVKD